MEPNPQDPLTRSADIKVRKLLGRTYLQENRIDAAVDMYLQLQRDAPRDVDVLIVLANLYLIGGYPGTAEQLYRRVLHAQPGSILAAKQLAQALSAGNARVDAPSAFSPEAVEQLRSRLNSMMNTEKAAEIRSAADMVEKMKPAEQTGKRTAAQKDHIQQLMPALIEQNIRQARASGRTDLAEALQSLQIHLSLKSQDSTDGDTPA